MKVKHVEKQIEENVLVMSFPWYGEQSEKELEISLVFDDGEEWGIAARIRVPVQYNEQEYRNDVRDEVRSWGPLNYGTPLFKIQWNENESEVVKGEGERFPLLDFEELDM